jgi:ABC-2 type transport system permease protein
VFDAILRILALTRKELLAVLKDPRGRFTLFAPPILQCLIYGYVATYDLNDVPFAVLDRDRSASSRDLVARLSGSRVFRQVAELYREEDVKRWIDERRALLILQIDQDFERRLLMGQSADLQVIADGRNSNTAGTALGYVGTVIEAFNADWRAIHPVGEGQVREPLPFQAGASGTEDSGQNGETGLGPGLPKTPAPATQPTSAPAGIRVAIRAWYNPNLETRWHMIPSLIGTLTLLQTLLLTAMSVAREREQGTFDQLFVTPFRPAEIMAGKALPSFLVGLVQATNILLVAQLWFHIPFAGSFLTLYAGLSLFLLAAIGIGLLVSSVAATMQQAMLYSFLVMMPFALLSGLATPLSSMPQALQYVTLVNPLRYAIEIAERVYLEGAGLHLLVPDLWPLALIALVTLSAASWLFRTRLT